MRSKIINIGRKRNSKLFCNLLLIQKESIVSQGSVSLLTEVPPPPTCHVSGVMCHVSRVTCHVSHVTCHVSHVACLVVLNYYYLFFLEKEVKLVGGGFVINEAPPSSFLRTNFFVKYSRTHIILPDWMAAGIFIVIFLVSELCDI